MIYYIVAVLFPLLIKIINSTNKYYSTDLQSSTAEQKGKVWVYLAALPMFALIAFRGVSIGPDTGVYRIMFANAIHKDWSNLTDGESVESGFLVFEKIVSLFTTDAFVYQIICAFIYYVSVVEFARNFKGVEFDILYLYGTLGLYKFMFTGVRQCLAMCICLWSFKLIKERKFIGFCMLLALAYTFHKSAILFLPAYFMYNKKNSSVFSLLMILFVLVVPFATPALQSWMANLLNYEYEEVENAQNGFLSFICVLLITVFSIFAMANKSSAEGIHDIRRLNNVSYFALVLWTMRLITRVAERPSYYFMFFTMVLFAYCLNLFKDSKEGVFVRLVAYFLAFLLFMYKMNVSLYLPYAFDWVSIL